MNKEQATGRDRGRYLASGGRQRGRPVRWLQMTMLVIWDGVLLYMIADCLIEPVCGAVFVGVISIYLGYQL